MVSKLLINERPLMVLPSLVLAVGSLQQAIILQQIHWMLQQPRSGVEHDGYRWVWGSYEEWANDYFPMWKARTLRKHITALEKAGWLVSCRVKSSNYDQTKHYRINYNMFDMLLPMWHERDTPNRHERDTPNRHERDSSIYRTETSTETSTEREPSTDEVGSESTNRHGPLSQPSDPRIRLEDPPSGPKRNGSSGKSKTRRPSKPTYLDPRKLVDNYIPEGKGNTAYEVYREVFRYPLNLPQLHRLANNITDLARWRAVVQAWGDSGYSPTNIKGMLDWYNTRIPSGPPWRNGAGGPAQQIDEPDAIFDPLNGGDA